MYTKRGYTLIEVMVAVGIFTIVIAAPTGFLVSSIKGQQKALASQEVLDETSYALEYISRSLRMAKKELNCTGKLEPTTCACLKSVGYGTNYELTREGRGIKFTNYQNQCQEFFLDINDNRLKGAKDGGEAIPLTSDDLEIVSFMVNIIGERQTTLDGYIDNKQPKITLFLEVKGIESARPELQPKIQIQTTISQRNLDVTY